MLTHSHTQAPPHPSQQAWVTVRPTAKLEPVGCVSSEVHFHKCLCLIRASQTQPTVSQTLFPSHAGHSRLQRESELPVHLHHLDFTIGDAGGQGSDALGLLHEQSGHSIFHAQQGWRGSSVSKPRIPVCTWVQLGAHTSPQVCTWLQLETCTSTVLSALIQFTRKQRRRKPGHGLMSWARACL